MSSVRASRVGEQIKKSLGQIIQQEIKDPRIGFVTVTHVDVTRDLETAKIYLSILGNDKEKKSSWIGLTRATGFMRKEIGNRLRLRVVPELKLLEDTTLTNSAYIENLLKQANIKPLQD